MAATGTQRCFAAALGLGQKIFSLGEVFSVKKPKADSGAMIKARSGQGFGLRVTTEETCHMPRSSLFATIESCSKS